MKCRKVPQGKGSKKYLDEGIHEDIDRRGRLCPRRHYGPTSYAGGDRSVWTTFSPRGLGQDAITSLAYLAGKTERIKLGTGIMQISARVPTMTAMTALS